MHNVSSNDPVFVIHQSIVTYSVQRLKGAIDSRIAEEQAKTRALTESPNSSTSLARKTTAISTNQKRTRSKIKVEDDGIRGPDPSEFEEDKFVIDSDDTGENKDEKAVTVLAEEQNTEKVPISLESTHKMDIPEQNKIDETKAEVAAAELPVEVKAKLRKLDKLESRYQGCSFPPCRDLPPKTNVMSQNCSNPTGSRIPELYLSSHSRKLSGRTHH